MSYWRRADTGKWAVRVYAGTNPLDGKRRFVGAGGIDSEKEARRLERELQAEVEHTRGGEETLGHHFTEWLEQDIRPRRAANTYRAYSKGVAELRRYQQLWLTPLRQVTKPVMRRWAAGLAERDISDTWRHSLFMYVSAGFQQAVRDDKIERNPLDGVPRPVKPAPRIRRYDPRVFDAILAACQADEALAAKGLILQWDTGARESDVLNLVMDSVHLEDPAEPWLQFGVVTAKTPAGIRGVALSAIGKAALEEVLAVHDEWADAWGWNEQEHDWLFRDLGTGRRLQDGRLGKTLRRIKAELGITTEIEGTHELRRWWATEAAARGASAIEITKTLGQSTLSMALRYTQESADMRRAVRLRMGDRGVRLPDVKKPARNIPDEWLEQAR